MREMKRGYIVKIYNTTPSGEIVEEGDAKLIKEFGNLGQWLVRFDDGMEVLRTVNPDDVLLSG